MSTLGKAVILFAAETATFRSDVGRAVAIFDRGLGQMQRGLRGFDGPLARLAAGFSAAGVVAFVKHTIDAADSIGKLSDKTNISTEVLSGWKLAADLGDVSAEGFAKGLREFSKSIIEASDASSRSARVFRALGVDIKAGPAEAFRQFAEQISKIKDSGLRESALAEILGKGTGAEWHSTLLGGAKALDEAREKAERLGLVISDDFARQAARFNDNVQLMQKAGIGFTNAVLQGGMLDALAEMSEHIAKAAEKGEFWLGVLREIKKLGLANLSAAANAGLLGGVGIGVGPLAERAAERAFGEPDLWGYVRSMRQRWGLDKPAAPAAEAAAPDPEAVRRAVAETEALQKRQLSALLAMEERRKSLFNLNEQEIMLERIKTGTYKEFDAQTKVRLLNLALEIDLRKESQERLELETKAIQAHADRIERGNELVQDYVRLGRESAAQMGVEADLVGRTVGEQEKLNALRRIDLDLQERRRQAAATWGDDVGGFNRENARLEAEAARQRATVLDALALRQQRERAEVVLRNAEAVRFDTQMLTASGREREKLEAIRALEIQQYGRVLTLQERSNLLTADDIRLRRELIGAIEERQAIERDWLTGARQGLEGYAEAATDAASTTREAFSRGLSAAEDSLVDFNKSWKDKIRDLVSFTLTEFARMAVRQNITGPLAQAGSNLLGSLFGGGNAGGSLAADYTGSAFGFQFAAGGVMTSRGALPLHRYASGGIARSPQLAVFGEGSMAEAYVPLPDGRRIPVALEGGGAGGRGDTYYIDARGADSAAVARLEQTIREVNGSIEHRSVAATANARSRGGAFRHQFRN